MKRYIRTTDTTILDVIIYTDHPAFYEGADVAAAIDVSKLNLPTRPVISKDLDKIEQWMIDDFESFMETVESICEENYGLIGVYKNVSDDHSHYYNYLATDGEGNIIIDFRLRLRISNHRPHRTREQQHEKSKELSSEELNRLLTEQEISRLKPYAQIITVNSDLYRTYEEAMTHVDSVIEHSVEVMKKNANYRPKKPYVPKEISNS